MCALKISTMAFERALEPHPTSAPLATRAPTELHGDLAVWIIILAEMAVFGIFFWAFAGARMAHVAAFHHDQATLDLRFGGINTALLISASACMVMAIDAAQKLQRRATLGWLLGCLAGGAGFVLIKLTEYSAKWAAGIDLSSSTFFMFYFLLTGFHFAHVLAGMVFVGWVGWLTARRPAAQAPLHALRSAGAFWHMVDLLWIVLFPLIYGLH
ncbi:MAG: cytochrome c oxidase subunit 3 family protein [Rhodoferax sp.]